MTDYEVELNSLKAKGEAPQWLSVEGYTTLSKGYRLKGETPKAMYRRVADAAAKNLYKDSYNFLKIKSLADTFFDYMYNKNWLCPASPVLSNLGTDRGLPISCFGIDIGDSVKSITEGIGELAALSKAGGGVGVNMQRIRERGAEINNGKNGKTEGIIPFAKMYDSTILGISQGATRRGAASINLNIEHGDWEEFIRMRRPEGDPSRQCGYLHHCSVISDEFMNRVVSGDAVARAKWVELMKARIETGESYIMFKDTVNRNNPEAYKKNGLEVDMTNICSEITLYTDDDHSFICCLSSLNLTRYDEWKNSDLPYVTTLFLNGVLNEFIDKGKYIYGMDKVVRSAEKGRAIGIGVLGWHTLLQQKSIPFASFQAMTLNNEIFKKIDEDSLKASQELAKEFGEPAWCKGTGEYNSHRTAIAPTRSNSIISGDVSPGIEPIIANAYTDNTAKGTFIRRNKELEKVLEAHGKNDDRTWKDISGNSGSVQHLDFLSDHEKNVFKTAYEIDQNVLIQQASQRQKYICQAQSLNLFFPFGVDPKYFNDVHLQAWRLGVKTLYYCRSTSAIQVDHTGADCESCEG